MFFYNYFMFKKDFKNINQINYFVLLKKYGEYLSRNYSIDQGRRRKRK